MAPCALLLAAVLTAASPNDQPGAGPVTSDPRHPHDVTGPGAILLMTLTRGMPTLELMIDGKGPFHVAFDTGAPEGPDLSERVVQALGLQRSGQAVTGDPSGKNDAVAPLYRIGDLAFGAVHARGWDATAGAAPAGLEAIDAVVGLGAFDGYVVTLDYAAGRFTLARGALPAADGKHVFAYRGDIPHVPLTIEGRTIDAHLDTGNIAHGVIVPTAVAKGLKRTAQTRLIGEARTVSNTMKIFSTPVDGPLRVGSTQLNATDVAYPALIPLANVGSLALTGAVVQIDPAHHRVALRAGQG